ncbi:hypothetical protein SB724_19195 [Bacillus sp. SIMBA_031]
MADAFIYMYFLCLGGSLGILTTAAIGYKLFQRSKNKQQRKRKFSRV